MNLSIFLILLLSHASLAEEPETVNHGSEEISLGDHLRAQSIARAHVTAAEEKKIEQYSVEELTFGYLNPKSDPGIVSSMREKLIHKILEDERDRIAFENAIKDFVEKYGSQNQDLGEAATVAERMMTIATAIGNNLKRKKTSSEEWGGYYAALPGLAAAWLVNSYLKKGPLKEKTSCESLFGAKPKRFSLQNIALGASNLARASARFGVSVSIVSITVRVGQMIGKIVKPRNYQEFVDLGDEVNSLMTLVDPAWKKHPASVSRKSPSTNRPGTSSR